jgi:hypothetical protein
MEFAIRSGHYKTPDPGNTETCAVKSTEKLCLLRRQQALPWALAWLLLGAGCAQLLAPDTTVTSTPTDAEAAADPEPAPSEPAPLAGDHLSPAERAEVDDLLERAARAIQRDHLTYPSQGSALALYDEVRILDPDNDEARRGLERMVERYLELALGAARQGRIPQAQAMLDRGHLVDPNHPGLAPTRAQIELLAEADRQIFRLDGELLRDRDDSLWGSLRQAGLASRGDGCRAEITARNDSEGRWIYQQMSEASGGGRIQAELNIGSPAQIEVLCFSSDS